MVLMRVSLRKGDEKFVNIFSISGLCLYRSLVFVSKSGDSWYFRLVSIVQRSVWNEIQFVNLVNLLHEKELVDVDSLD